MAIDPHAWAQAAADLKLAVDITVALDKAKNAAKVAEAEIATRQVRVSADSDADSRLHD